MPPLPTILSLASEAHSGPEHTSFLLSVPQDAVAKVYLHISAFIIFPKP